MTLAVNILILIIFLLFLYIILKQDFKIFFLYGLLVFQGLAIVPSLIYIEQGIFISEQGRESYFVGATFAYVVYFIITFLILFLTFNSLKKFKAITPRFNIAGRPADKKIIYYIAIFTLALLFFNASQSKLPLFDSSVSRFTYWENSKFPFLNKILGNISVFIPFILGVLYKDNKFRSILILMLYFTYNFLIGQKFSPIVSGLFSFFLPIIIISDIRINFRTIFNRKIIFSFLVLFGVVYTIIYKRYEKTSPYAIIKIYDPNEAIFYRAFGLQGHLMWGSVETYVYNGEKQSYKFSDLSRGMHKLMDRFALKRRGYEQAKESGFNFTNGYPSILFYVYPTVISLIVHVLMTIIFLGFTGWLLTRFILHESYVLAVVMYQLFNWVIYAFTMGYFYKLKYMAVFLVCYAIFVVLNNSKKNIQLKRFIDND